MLHDSTITCPLCEFTTQIYLFTRHGARIVRCGNCGLTGLTGAAQRSVPDGTPTSESVRPASSFTERKAAETYVATLRARNAASSGMLVVADEEHPFIAVAHAQGFSVETELTMRELERDGIPVGPYQSAVVLFQLEKAANPLAALAQIHRAVVPGGVLLIVTPSLDSWPARVLRSQWTEWQPENRWYFDTQTIQSACLRGGFAAVEWTPYQRRYTLDHLHGRAVRSLPTRLTRLIQQLAPFVPGPWRRHVRVTLPASGLIVTAQRVEQPARPLLSVVMPVFNERATFEQTLQAVLAKECAGVDKEIVIVESRSTDGTRELVRKYEDRPGITVVLEDRPRGKGAAVRTALQRAKGTLILIQDADSEYDVNDYDALLEPLLTLRRAFVLGSRHVGSWKMRRFANQHATTLFFNFGHVLFRTALNVLYGQTIRDPFTMYKVFRRDCLHQLRFECNRFDFDFELVIKLLRKGYVPLEVPVNYESRSFKDGKKVSPWRDPLTWLRALVKYRIVSIYCDRR
jgi:SAM-dependent methyltransferase